MFRISQLHSLRNRRDGAPGSIFRREDGVIDLLSIMVGVILLGILAGGVVAMVFGVVPWAQDNAASQNLDAVINAEGVYYAQGLETGTGDFGTFTQLKAGRDNSGPLIQDSTTIDVVTFGIETTDPNGTPSDSTDDVDAATLADSDRYVAVSQSATGARYYVTDASSEKVDLASLDADAQAAAALATAPIWDN